MGPSRRKIKKHKSYFQPIAKKEKNIRNSIPICRGRRKKRKWLTSEKQQARQIVAVGDQPTAAAMLLPYVKCKKP